MAHHTKTTSIQSNVSIVALHHEESGASDFGTVYMILIFAIAALLLVVVIKPIYQNAQKSIPKKTA